MKRSIIRDFWIILVLCYGILAIGLHAEDSNLKKALVLVNQGRTDDAIVILNREAQQGTSEPETHLALGVTYLEKNEYGLAKSHLEKVLELKPDSLPAHYSLAMLFEKEHDYGRAAAEWEKVSRLSDDRDVRDLAAKHLRQIQGIR